MAHFAKHPAVLAQNSLNRVHRTVGVIPNVHSGHAALVYILRRHLVVLNQLGNSPAPLPKRPSPWKLPRCTPPGSTPASHGDFTEVILFLQCTRYVPTNGVVCQSGAVCAHRRISHRHQSQLNERLKAVADAQHRHPSAFNSSITASATLGLRSVVAINFPEPSGSSPAEKPPGIIIIWLSSMALACSCIEASISCTERLRMITTFALAPALSKAAAVSYSQLVPGNTGMTTCGQPNLFSGHDLWPCHSYRGI